MVKEDVSDFMVTVSMVGKVRLGVDVDWGDNKTLLVNSVHPGAVEDWNREHPGQEIRPGARIIAVNGVSGDAHAMLRECQAKRLLQLIVRPPVSDGQGNATGSAESRGEPAPVAAASDGGSSGSASSFPAAGQRPAAFVPGVAPRGTVEILADIRKGRAPASGSAASGGTSKAAGSADEPPDYYTVLEVERSTDESGIKKSYRKLVLQWHPDKHPVNLDEAEEKIRLINNAYETLGNPLKRAGYDQMLAALERKRSGVRLDTSFIKPRMSIPKEFMLCPLGHPDKFVRVVDEGLKVVSRDDEPDVSFTDFFRWAKFSLWWLPEVNNMCRLRVQESAARGMEGGLNLNFMLEEEKVAATKKTSEVSLSASENPQSSNMMVMASPFIEGAFRFEGAFWPNRYLSFRPPGKLHMAGLDDDPRDVVDFLLVDYSAMYKYMTMDEVLIRAVQGQGKGDGFVKLSDLRADMSVRVYFQRTLGCAVWNNRDFETFFEGHFEQWDYDQKRARVRMRTREKKVNIAAKAPISHAARAPTGSSSKNCVERLQRAERPEQVAHALLQASEEELGCMPADAAIYALTRLAEAVAGGTDLQDYASAGKMLLNAVPSLCERGGEDGLGLALLLHLHRAASSMATAYSGTDIDLMSSVGWTRRRLAALANARLSQTPEELKVDLLQELLSMPFDWEVATDTLLSDEDRKSVV